MATIGEIIRDPNMSESEKWEAVARLADIIDPLAVDPVIVEPRKMWSTSAVIEDVSWAEKTLDEAWENVNLDEWTSGGLSSKLAQEQFDAAKMDVLSDLAALTTDRSVVVSISGSEAKEGDEGSSWSHSISVT